MGLLDKITPRHFDLETLSPFLCQIFVRIGLEELSLIMIFKERV